MRYRIEIDLRSDDLNDTEWRSASTFESDAAVKDYADELATDLHVGIGARDSNWRVLVDASGRLVSDGYLSTLRDAS